MKDTTFFNAESGSYSAKRYPERAVTFTQYFFKRRLACTLAALAPAMKASGTSVLELGCADGFVAAAIANRFKGTITRFDALDQAPEMISAARSRYGDSLIRFGVRTATSLESTYDVIVEVGVLNYTEFEPELDAVAAALAPGGTYICSIAGSSSLQNRLKGAEGYAHLRSYAEYESAFLKRFRITSIRPVGFFIPHIWKAPLLARVVQPIAEAILGAFAPRAALEHLYVLTPR